MKDGAGRLRVSCPGAPATTPKAGAGGQSEASNRGRHDLLHNEATAFSSVGRPHVNTSMRSTWGVRCAVTSCSGDLNGWTSSGITTWQAGGNLQANSTQNLGLTVLNTTLNHSVSSSTYLELQLSRFFLFWTCNPTSGLKANQEVNLDCFSAPRSARKAFGRRLYLSGASYFDTDAPVSTRRSASANELAAVPSTGIQLELNHPLPGFSNNDPITAQATDGYITAPSRHR